MIGGVRFLGCTLWTDYALYGDTGAAMAAAARGLNDHRLIRRQGRLFSPADALDRHVTEKIWLAGALARKHDGPTVVVTHHCVSQKSVHSRWGRTPVSAAFSSNLDVLVEGSGAALWVHGHTHDSFDYALGGTRVICNPKGYGPTYATAIAENLAFDPRLVVEIEGGRDADDRMSARRPLRLWVLSDLHLDRFEGWSAGRIPLADVAVVAGGVTPGLVEAVGWLGLHLRPHMPVVFVPGPHDYYGTVLPTERARARRAAAFADVHLLDGAECGIAGVRFVAARSGPTSCSSARSAVARRCMRRCSSHAGGSWPGRRFAGGSGRKRRRTCTPGIWPAWSAGLRVPSRADGRGDPPRAERAVAAAAPSERRRLRGDRLGPVGAHRARVAGSVGHGAVPEPVDVHVGRTRILANPRWSGTQRFAGGFDPALVVEV